MPCSRGSKDGSTQAAGKGGFKIAGEPCVWCGDGPGPQCHMSLARRGLSEFVELRTCTTDSAAKCAPYDWVMNGKGVALTSVDVT